MVDAADKKERELKSSTKKQCLECDWNEEFEFNIKVGEDKKVLEEFRIEVWDENFKFFGIKSYDNKLLGKNLKLKKELLMK
jgi:hypothetical protein